MHILRGAYSQRSLKKNLTRSVVQQVLPSNNMGDALIRVISDNCKLIGPKTVRTFEYNISDLSFNVLHKSAAEPVRKDNRMRTSEKTKRSHRFPVRAAAACSGINAFGKIKPEILLFNRFA